MINPLPPRAGRHVVALAWLGCLCLPAAQAEEGARIKTPQEAAIQFTSGRVLRGTLLSVDDKQVRFQLMREGTAPAVYKPEQIRAIRTADDLYIYNGAKGRFESLKAAQATTAPANPPDLPKPPRRDPGEKVSDAKPVEGSQVVVVEGVGAEPDDALKDAFRAAVHQVVGTLVDAETMVKNEEVISDKVLTYSDGIIKGGYKELSRKRDRGLWRIKISATVERRSVVTRLKEANVTIKGVEGKDLAVEVLTRKEARENATKLMQRALADLPKVLVAEARKPDGSDYDEDTQTLRVDVLVRADAEKYRTFLKRLLPLLDKVSLAQDFALMKSDLEDDGSKDGGPKVFRAAHTKGFAGLGLPPDQKGWYLWVLTHSDAQWVRTRWNYYLVDSDMPKSLSGVQGKLSVLVSLLDKDGQTITEDEVPLEKDVTYPWIGYLAEHWEYNDRESKHVETYNVALAPLALRAGDGYLSYKPAKLYRRQVKLTESELKRLKDIKCAIIFRPTDR